MLPVLGQEPPPTPSIPTTREDPQNLAPVGGTERTVIRVEGMDCASCAVTVEKRVGQLPGVRRAVVNFASGRLDAEHDPGLTLEEIEKAVRDAGYGVAKTEEVESTPFWRTPRALSVFASALLFALGLALGLSGAPEFARGGRLPRGHRGRWVADLPGGRGRLEGEAPGHERLDERSHSGCSGDRGSGRRPPRWWSSSPPGTLCRSTP